MTHSSRQAASCQPGQRRARRAALAAGLVGALAAALVPGQSASARSHGPQLVVAGSAGGYQPYVDDNGTLYASAEFVRAMGASYTHERGSDSVEIAASGRTSVWPCDVHHGQPMIPVAGVAQLLGGVYSWDSTTQTGVILARIRAIREQGDRLTVDTSYPVQYSVDAMDRPRRVYVDVRSASLGGPETTIPVSGDDVAEVRAKQMTPDTVRVVVDLKRPLTYTVASAQESDHVSVNLVGDDASSGSAGRSAYGRLRVTADGAGDDSASGQPPASDAAPQQAPLAPKGLSSDPGRGDVAPRITAIAYDASKLGMLQVKITVAGAYAGGAPGYKTFLLDQPNRLAFDIPGGRFALAGSLTAGHADSLPLVSAEAKSIRWGMVRFSATPLSRVVIDLYRPLSYSVASNAQPDGTTLYTVSLLLGDAAPAAPGRVYPAQVAESGGSDGLGPVAPLVPPAPPLASPPAPGAPPAAGELPPAGTEPVPPPTILTPSHGSPRSALSGRTIVVDAGHGGRDTGAPGINGLYEKNVTLAIAKLLRDQLVASGARVVMTRSDDVFIPVDARPEMGVANHADLFVSIHADASGSRNSHNGATIYYHANLPAPRALAADIATRLTQVSDGIQTEGVRTDYVRFPGVGYGVLRLSPEPAVLVETGYVNSDHDAELLTNPATQKLIAMGIVNGLKDFAATLPPRRSDYAADPSPALALTQP